MYVDELATINQKIKQYADHWEQHKGQIIAALSDAFEEFAVRELTKQVIAGCPLEDLCPYLEELLC